MHRPSPLQAELDAQSLRRHDVEQRFIAAPETYTALAGRPGRVLVAGIGVGVVVLALVAVISIAGATRAARARSQAATEAGRANPPTATTRAPSQQPATAGRAGADGKRLVSRSVVIERSGTVILDGWEDDSIDLVDTGRVLVTI
jgi:hypothetical protein